ncbi:MAG: hypothetical protein IPM36_04430 [Lewinellaceae bacterium]|nr:hypothetical protein [Lewinellaceae bacterium]
MPAFKAEEPPAAVAEEKALQYALELISTKNYLWLDKKAEEALKERTQNREASFYPKGELVWLQTVAGEKFRLAWKFDINTADGLSGMHLPGCRYHGLLKRYPLDIHFDPGSGTTTWHGTQTINTSQPGSNFILLDDCQAPNIHVFNAQDSSSTAFSTEYTDADNNWTTMAQQSAVQTFSALTQSGSILLNRHWPRQLRQRRRHYSNGYNQAGLSATMVCATGATPKTGPGLQIHNFGDNGTDGTVTDDWNTIDIVGHEFYTPSLPMKPIWCTPPDRAPLDKIVQRHFGGEWWSCTPPVRRIGWSAPTAATSQHEQPGDRNDPDVPGHQLGFHRGHLRRHQRPVWRAHQQRRAEFLVLPVVRRRQRHQR